MINCYVALGSNLDNPFKHLKTALKDLANLPQTHLIKSSSFYFTEAMGDKEQDDYLNAVVLLKTTLSAAALLSALLEIERQHGRVRGEVRWQARTLDCDILLYGHYVIHTAHLTIPHYGLKDRLFVLKPLYEIEPELILPDGTVLRELMRRYQSSIEV